MHCQCVFLTRSLSFPTVAQVLWPLALLLLLWSAVGQAGLASPECGAVAAWSEQYDAKQTYQAAPSIALPQAVGTAQFRKLFGAPVEEWSKKDFADFDRQLKVCQGKLFKTNRKQAKQLNAVRKQFRRLARSTQALAKAAKQGGRAIDAIAALPDTNSLEVVLKNAAAILRGEQNKPSSGLPRKAVQALSALSRAYPQMAVSQSQTLLQRIGKRRQTLQSALAAEAAAQQQAEERAREQAQQQLKAAREALVAARGELQALPVAPESLAELERLAALPAIARVPEAESQPYRDALKKKREAIDAIVQREHSAEIAAQIDRQIALLNDATIDKLADLGGYRRNYATLIKLLRDPKNAEAVKASRYAESDRQRFEAVFDQAVTRLLPQFEQELAQVPSTAAGQQQLQNIVVDVTGVGHGVAAMKPYYAAARKRYQAIDAALKHAEQWYSAVPRLEQLLPRDEVDEATLNGLRLGVAESDAVAVVRGQWNFQQRPHMSLTKSYGPGRAAVPQLEKERRSGGEITFKSMPDQVGQVEWVEHYKAQLELAPVKHWLVERFGKADSEQAEPLGFNWTWKDGDQRLQVAASNQVDVLAAAANYRSKLRIALWNEDYEDYLTEVDQRCDKLRKTPRSEFSMDDSMFFVKAECPLVDGHPKEAGLD